MGLSSSLFFSYVASLFEPFYPITPIAQKFSVFRVGSSPAAHAELLDLTHHELIEFVQVNVGQNWRDNPSLRCPAVRAVVSPVFHVSGLQKSPNQVQKLSVINTFAHKMQQAIMVDIVEVPFDVYVTDPFGSLPAIPYLIEGGMT